MKHAREFRGETLDAALSEACSALKARIGELRYDVESSEDGDEVVVQAEVDPVAVLGLFLSETFRAGRARGDGAPRGDRGGPRGRALRQ